MAIDFGSLANEITEVDHLLFTGELSDASAMVRELIENAAHAFPDDEFLRSLAMGLIEQRAAIIEHRAGNEDEADRAFGRARALLGEAQGVASREDLSVAAAKALNLSNQQHKDLEFTRSSLPKSCYAVCEHGCKIAIPPCGYTSQHC
jgi:hypothetical protein